MPLAKEIDDFAFAGTPINESLIRDPATGAFLAEQRNAVLIGGTGTGKSHLAIAIAQACIRGGARGRFYTVVDLVNRLEGEARAGRQHRLAEYLWRLRLPAATLRAIYRCLRCRKGRSWPQTIGHPRECRLDNPTEYGVCLMQNIIAAAAAAIFLTGATAAYATPACTDIFASSSSNGTTTFPGTNVGPLGGPGSGDVCQIGNLSLFNSGSGGAFVNTSANPSNYEFYWGGGSETIQEEVGNNGIGYNIDVELDSLASETSTSPSAILASIQIPYSSGPSAEFDVINNYSLPAGWYTLSTYLGPCGNSSLCDNNNSGVTDPNYQANSLSTSIPEPASLAVFSMGLLGLGLLGLLRCRSGGV